MKQIILLASVAVASLSLAACQKKADGTVVPASPVAQSETINAAQDATSAAVGAVSASTLGANSTDAFVSSGAMSDMYEVRAGQIAQQRGHSSSVKAFAKMMVALMLCYWKRERDEQALPPERFFQALRAGLRYAHMASPFRAVLIRATAFILFATSAWALLPLIARHELAGGPGTYGLLLTFVGIGAAAAAVLLPRIRAHIARDRLVLIATIVYALTTAGLATIRSESVLYGVMAICGAAWISVLSSLQVAAQISVPAWVRGRALSLYIMIFSAGMTLGSLLWGWVAAQAGTPAALLVSAAGAVLAGAGRP